MNGFLLLTTSLLVMLQLQTGVFGNHTSGSSVTVAMIPAITPAMTPGIATATAPATISSMAMGPKATVTTRIRIRTTSRTWTTTMTNFRTTAGNKTKNGAPALSDLGGGSFLFFLIHTLIYLFYLS
ncbi:hypothetical protein GW7_08413 [Heterocephalus glaber]|uniref:CAMPATH-1 antigen n=1 Tax=Heterocephalus glaber TaxID=10181 RepID=G5AUR3_HETGA|nr:hypothetical protein GW7_08413 [Heterocephalus glaber]